MRLVPGGVLGGQFRVHVTGQGARVVVEVSTNLTDWSAVLTNELVEGATAFSDPAVIQGGQRFYRGRMVLLHEITPSEVTMFAGDSILFRVNEASRGTAWIFKVNGVTNGNAALGTLEPHPADPATAAYRAPSGISRPVHFRVCAEDPSDPARTFCGTVTVYPLPATLVVTPAAVTLRLGGTQQFAVGAQVEGAGFVPWNQGVWKINGHVGADPSLQLGMIDLDGRFTAPPKMPPNLPRTIEVGFSPTLEGPVLAAASVTLAELRVSPPHLVSLQAGPVGTVTAELRLSDNTTSILGPGQVAFQSSFDAAATVDGSGNITVGDAMGVASISATHLATGATDSMLVESRPDVHLRLLSVRQRSPHVINVNPTASGVVFQAPDTPIHEIEVTQPGVLLNLAPDIFFFRGATNFNTSSFAGAGHRAVSFLGDGNLVRDFELDGRVVHTAGLVARVERHTGFVEFGDTPGAGVVTMIYDDGVVTRTTTTTLRYTRLNLAAELRGAVTGQTNEAFLSEWLALRIRVTNPRTQNSRFMGDTILRVRQQGEPFLVAHIPETVGFIRLPAPKHFVETTEYVHLLPSGPSDRNPGQFSPGLGEVQLWVMARRTGEHRFVVDMPSDPGVPPVELAIHLKPPPLDIRPAAGLSAGSAIVQNSYFDLQLPAGPPSFLSTPMHPEVTFGAGSYHERETLAWFVKRPNGQTNVLIAEVWNGQLGSFPTTLRETGPHEIWLGYRNHPGMRTAGVAVNVVAPAAGQFDELPPLARKEVMDDGILVPPSQQYAGVQFESPVVGGFTDGVPLTVVARLYAADGVAKRLGKRIVRRFRRSNQPDQASFTTNYVLGGAFVASSAGSRFFRLDQSAAIGGLFPADPDGFVHFNLTVPPDRDPTQIRRPVRLTLRPGFVSVDPAQLPQAPEGLPTEFLDYLDGVLVAATRVPLGVAEYVNPADTAYLFQTLAFPGRGVSALPSAIPVASRRVRDAVTAGRLPPGSDRATFALHGPAEFAAALAGAEPHVAVLVFDSTWATYEPDPGIRVISQRTEGARLIVEVSTDLDYYEADESGARYGNRTVRLAFPDGSVWVSEILLFGGRIELHPSMSDRNIPLNAAYGYWEIGPNGRPIPFREEEGSVLFELQGRPVFRGILRTVELHLLPSLHATWDANRNGEEDPGEDLDGDGFLTEQDIALPVSFRSARPENPLVGFRREVDPRTGAFRVRQLVREIAPSFGGQFRVFGDPTDHRRLDPETRRLSEKFDPDLIPDFVSPVADAEGLLARHGGNLLDVRFFSVYNFMTEMREDLADPGFALDRLVLAPNPRDATYGAYRSVDDSLIFGSPAAETRASRTLAAFVDHDATPFDFHPDEPVLYGFFPFQFYGGVLDQAWQRRVINVRSSGLPGAVPMFTDDRFRPYSSRYVGPTPTGAQRVTFGVDLDGVLYDPTSINFPKPRFHDFFGDRKPVAEFLASQRVDADPNSAELLGLPVVAAALGDLTLTDANLLRRIGGTSGGFADRTRHAPGRLGAEAKTPGADLPGLHAGFLTFGRPDQLIDPRNSLLEDDIRDVLIKRDDTGRLIREDRFLGTPAPRFVHGFANNEDRKRSIRTAVQARLHFAVLTDPPNVTPEDPATWKLRPNILVREQLAADNRPDLVVTSQSEGHEPILKLVADTAVDFVVDMTAGAVLATVTGGGFEGFFLGACEHPELGRQALGAIRNLVFGIVDAEFMEPYFEKSNRDAIHFIHRNFTSLTVTNLPIPGVNWGASTRLLGDPLLYPNILRVLTNAPDNPSTNGVGIISRALLHISSHLRIPDFLNRPTSFCDLLNHPLEKLKDEIKATFSAETFGGLGSAEAVGVKILSIAIPLEAQLSPGVFSQTYSIIRKIDVQPREPTEVTLESLPWQRVFATYPYADVVPDETFLRTLLGRRFDPDPAVAAAATEIWRAVQRKSVRRSVENIRYQSYKLRAWQMPGISATLAPFQNTGTGRRVGDFVLIPNQTILPVTVAAGAMVSRANENATARALVTTPGYEVILRQGTLMKPLNNP
ncbi:hypothetical protein [Limisphaera sp. VF-2]|uniref:hypothetical protein n=1 Tax=Limisphaera sp. VF-2 TaxID=3400418 RepID=UPI0017766726